MFVARAIWSIKKTSQTHRGCQQMEAQFYSIST